MLSTMHAFMRRKFTLRDDLARMGSYLGLEKERCLIWKTFVRNLKVMEKNIENQWKQLLNRILPPRTQAVDKAAEDYSCISHSAKKKLESAQDSHNKCTGILCCKIIII